MSERYLVTGVQLGMMKAMTLEQIEKIIDEIIDKQFVGNSTRNLNDDVRSISKEF